MKKALLLATVIVAVIAGLTLSVVRYQNYQNKQTQAQLTAVQKLGDRVDQLQSKYQNEVTTAKTQYNSLQAECMKGKAVYDSLTPALKAKVAAPDCGSVLQ